MKKILVVIPELTVILFTICKSEMVSAVSLPIMSAASSRLKSSEFTVLRS